MKPGLAEQFRAHLPQQSLVYQTVQTPSRAEHGLGGRYALSESAQVCIGARPTGAFPLVMSGDGIDYRGGVIR